MKDNRQKEYGKGIHEGHGGRGHPIVLDGKQKQRPEEQRLWKAVNNGTRLKTVTGEPVNQAHNLSIVKRLS